MKKKIVLASSLTIFLMASHHARCAEQNTIPTEQSASNTAHDSDEMPYDDLDYIAEHKETISAHSYVPHWIKKLCMELIIRYIAISNYCEKHIKKFKQLLTQ